MAILKRPKRKNGRPRQYSRKKDEQAFKLCLLGATDDDLADFFGVTPKTLRNWKREEPSFRKAIADGKTKADAEVAHRMYLRCLGYSHPEEKILQHKGRVMRVGTIKHYPPDVQAIQTWLTNRRSEHWKNRQDHHHSGPNDGPIQTITRTVVDPKETK